MSIRNLSPKEELRHSKTSDSQELRRSSRPVGTSKSARPYASFSKNIVRGSTGNQNDYLLFTNNSTASLIIS